MRALDLDNISLMAFTHVKQRFSWENMEPLRGVWAWTEADGVVDEIERRGTEGRRPAGWPAGLGGQETRSSHRSAGRYGGVGRVLRDIGRAL